MGMDPKQMEGMFKQMGIDPSMMMQMMGILALLVEPIRGGATVLGVRH